ncbi:MULTISPECIES: type II toxin-antitoxin system RelE/ParE family toxin [Pseudomonas]|uniref:Plasmid stabilization system protein n=1 Tax=Pseudomonas asplenii TaxID=53407 RepID=A0A0N0VJA2_9PSED|nr:type II toxin-antitoxin system RelE/ParE family toxin [Pseudomonas fuscovaginae]KPA89165.1 plasmid stabilization system protein [Pseudomonas fuscovaginae]KPA97110.1 plasmid stabilization system protein [Pseudomonas fuscovaginae]
MTRTVFTHAAIRSIDMQELHLANKVGHQAASKYFGELEDKVENRLNDHPESGQLCLQAAELGAIQYRELNYNPYRVIYSHDAASDTAVVHLVLNQAQNVRDWLVHYCLIKDLD